MIASLHRRLKRVEAELIAPAAGREAVAILNEPGVGADPSELKRHQVALAEAMRDHAKVIVVSKRYRERTEAGEGLVYVGTEIQALIERCSTARSGKTKGKSADPAWLASLEHKIFGVVPQAGDPNYWPLDDEPGW